MSVNARPKAPFVPKRAQMYVNSAYWPLCIQFTSNLCEAAAREGRRRKIFDYKDRRKHRCDGNKHKRSVVRLE